MALETPIETVGVSITALGLLVVIFQLWLASRTERRTAAREYFREYLKKCMEHPEFAIPNKDYEPLEFRPGADGKLFGLFGPASEPDDLRKKRFDEYEWFVALVMESMEHLYRSNHSELTERIVTRALAYHVTYLRSDYVCEEGWLWDYTPEFRGFLIEKFALRRTEKPKFILPEPSYKEKFYTDPQG